MKNTLLMMSKIQSGVGTLSNLNRLIPLFILILLLLGIVLVLSRNQKLRHEKKIGIILVILLLVVSITFFQRNNQKKDLINISKLSEEFMDNYFTEYSSSKTEQEKENMLIVTSLNGIDNDYGAVKVIEAPNNQYILQYDSKEIKEKALENIKKDERILNVGENIKYEVEETEYNSWGINKMVLDNAIEVTNEKNLDEVVVAVLDTGCDMDLANKYYNGKIKETYNVLTNSVDDMSDTNGHGTHVLGTIAEGTPKNVKIIPIKISTDGSIYDSDILAAMNYVTYYDKADVINMSFGGYVYSAAEEQAINAANLKNIISVAAAGNDNSSDLHYPSSFENTISIASVDSNLKKSDFSNYGKTIDFTAPGSGIKSIMGRNATLSKNNDSDDDHETISGTSMATPHAVSAVATLKSYNKELNIDSIKKLLKKHAIDLGTTGRDRYYGDGFITFLNANFCEGENDDCDEYNVFKVSDEAEIKVKKIEADKASGNYIPYNYGNETNLSNIAIRIYYDDDYYIVKKLGELDEVEIENYDSNVVYDIDTGEGKQEITIKYGGTSTTITVMNLASTLNGWEYEILENKIKITNINYGNISNNFPIAVTIPEQINGYDVTILDSALFKNRSELYRVKLPSALTEIGSEAFYNCISLSKVELSNVIETIGNSAFKNTNLGSIDLPESLLSIGDNSFENTKITEAYIPKNVNKIGYYAFAGCNNINKISVDNDNSTYDSRNNSNTIIETDTNTLIKGNYISDIPATVKVIGEGSFYNDSRITEISIPDSVEKIDYSAFKYDENLVASSLEKVIIPSSVKEIKSAFNANDKNIIIYTYSNAYAKTYSTLNKISYKTMDYINVHGSLLKYKYKAFDTVAENLMVTANYNVGYYIGDNYYKDKIKQDIIFDDDIKNIASSGITISYQNDTESLRYGDTYIKVSGKDRYGNSFQTNSLVEVAKAIPEYLVPTNLEAKKGQLLSEITLPSGFEWMDPNLEISETGSQIFKAKYIPTDTTNYETVENIDITINVSKQKDVIIPEIKISNKTYDSTDIIDLESITISNLEESEYTVISAVSQNIDVGNAIATVKLRLTDAKYENYSFENGKQEEDFAVEFKIVPMKVKKPTKSSGDYVYNGNEITFDIIDYSDDYMNVSGNKGTNSGTYNVIISLKNKNYLWDDETEDNIVLVYKITKANIQVKDSSVNVTVKYDGKPHSIKMKLEYPTKAVLKYMDENGEYTLDKAPEYTNVGTYTIKYKLYIDDNYTEYLGERTLTITNNSIINNTTDYEGIYDGKEHSININIEPSDYSIKYSINNTNYDLTELPTFKNVGEYTINYKISANGYDDLEGSNKVKIYGIKEIDKSIVLKDNSLVIKDNSFNLISSKIITYATSSEYKHYDKDNKSIESDILKTGDIIKVILNQTTTYEYKLAYLGDTSGDGKINYLDYVNVYNHIQKIKHPESAKKLLTGEYLLAADMSGDNKISYLDYVKIYNKIKELKGGTN